MNKSVYCELKQEYLADSFIQSLVASSQQLDGLHETEIARAAVLTVALVAVAVAV